MKNLFYYIFICLIALVLLIIFCNTWVLKSTRQLSYDNIRKIPSRDVALVMGTVKELENGLPNVYFSYRIAAALALYQEGKVKHFLLTGDNSRRGYNEPEDMKLALIQKGVPENAITLDFAGFRTLDSIVRAKKVFGLESFIIVSQPFHNSRALFIAKKYGIDAVAFNAPKVRALANTKIKLRESLARVKAVLDLYVFRKQPKFLGEPVDIQIS